MIIDPLDFEKRPALNRLHNMRRLARLSLLWENATRAFWRMDCWIGFFVALWLLQIPALLGNAGNIGALALFLAGLLYFGRKSLREFQWPTQNDVDRQLEKTSGLKNRPLALLEDRLANPRKEETRTIRKHGRENSFALLSRLRPFFPRPLLAAQDPNALRGLVLVFLVAGFVVAGPQWPDRLHDGLVPFSLHRGGKASENIALWITPPEYTGLPQTILQGSGRIKDSANIPQGSVIKAQVHGLYGTPELLMGDKRNKMARSDGRNWSIEADAVNTETIIVRQMFLTRLKLPVNFIRDTPPEMSLKEKPKALPKGTLQIPLTVKDDYGIRRLTMRMTLDPSVGEAPLGAPVVETRPMASGPGEEKELLPLYDLSWHPWAGLPVVIEMETQDSLEQKAVIPPVHLTLPERPFYHPVAKQLVALRKRMIWTPAETIPNAVYELEETLNDPSQFENDIVAFLSIRSMASRLYYTPTEKSAIAVIEQLWDTALRIEDGNLTMASRDLRKAQQALQDLLNDPGATDEQIATAMENLRQTMAQYFMEMAREMQKRMAENNGDMPMIDPQMFKNMIDAQDLASFLDQMQAEALSGNRDSAQQLLSQLQQMMDGLDPSTSFSMPPLMQAMMDQMSAMKELIEKQQALLDKTQQEADKMKGSGTVTYPDFLPADPKVMKGWEKMMPPPPEAPRPEKKEDAPPIDTKAWQQQQDDLRKMLGDLMLDADEQLGDIPENMQDAEQEMRGSGKQLGENRPDLSAPHQQQAINELQDSMENMNQQMAQMMKQMTMMSFGMGPIDPLGRPLSQGDGPSLLPGSQVKIPDEAERRRVQEIMKTLRQRSGELERPDYELEYYRRLLRQF